MEANMPQVADGSVAISNREDGNAVVIEFELQAPGIVELSKFAIMQIVHAIVDAKLSEYEAEATDAVEVLAVSKQDKYRD